MGGRPRDQRARVLGAAGGSPARVLATGMVATGGRTGGDFHARAERHPRGRALMDTRARRAGVDSDPGAAGVDSRTRRAEAGP